MDRVAQQVAALARMSAKALRARYREVFGEEAKTGNAAWLRKRIAWRLQSLAEGDLSQRARQRAGELANDADLRMNAPVVKAVVVGSTHPAPRLAALPAEAEEPRQQPVSDGRVAPVGTVLTRAYKGKTLQVKVLADGFEYEGQKYTSLSALAKVITGNHCNGPAFFGIARKSKENKR
jgi:hypothetical protein